MSRKALLTATALVLIFLLALFLYRTFSVEPWSYTTRQEADALCTVRANGADTVYQACMEDYGY